MIREKLMKLLQIFLILAAVLIAIAFVVPLTFRSFLPAGFFFSGLGITELVIIAVILLTILFVWIGVAVAVYYDAKRRGMEPLLWALIAALVPYFLGLIAYLIFRQPIQAVCPSCGQPAAASDLFCKRCGHALQNRCPACNQPSPGDARYCANCGAPLSSQPGSAATPVSL